MAWYLHVWRKIWNNNNMVTTDLLAKYLFGYLSCWHIRRRSQINELRRWETVLSVTHNHIDFLCLPMIKKRPTHWKTKSFWILDIQHKCNLMWVYLYVWKNRTLHDYVIATFIRLARLKTQWGYIFPIL